MAINNKTNADYMLRQSLSCSERPSAALIAKVKSHSFNNRPTTRMSYRHKVVLIAATGALLIAVSTAALAATGVLGNVFSAITNGSIINGGLGSNSRKAIIEQGYVAEVAQGATAVDDSNMEHDNLADETQGVNAIESGAVLELKAYYADSKEIGFNFSLSGSDLPDNWDRIFFNYFSLEMSDRNGDINTWEWMVDSDSERKAYPGGYIFHDWTRNIFESEPGDIHDPDYIAGSDEQNFTIEAIAEKSDDDSFEITVVMSFINANAHIGEKAHLKIGNLSFFTNGDISDDNAVDKHTTLNGVWEFDFDVESRFANVSEIQYIVADAQEAERNGITIYSVTVLPSTCRIEAAIDYSKNSLANPENINTADSERLLGKLDWLDTWVTAESDNAVFGGMSSNYSAVNGRVVDCSFEIDSMFFDAPETIRLRFEGHGGTVIYIPLTLDR